MSWIRSHRYTVAFIGAVVFLIVGAVLAKNNRGTEPVRGEVVNVPVTYPYYAPSTNIEYAPANGAQENPQNAVSGAGNSASLFADFFAQKPRPKPENPPVQTATIVSPKVFPRVKPSEVPQEAPQNASTDNQYLLFFKALSNILNPVDTRTPEQKALYAYGNEAGSIIKTFEDSHTNVSQTLHTFFNSRIDRSKYPSPPKETADAFAQVIAFFENTAPVSGATATASLQKVANEYAQLSSAIGNIRPVPPSAAELNAKLSMGYADVAQGLSRMIKTENDAQLLEAIYAYNTRADEFIKNYVALVELFSVQGVKFSSSDPGAVFSFSGGGL